MSSTEKGDERLTGDPVVAEAFQRSGRGTSRLFHSQSQLLAVEGAQYPYLLGSQGERERGSNY